MKKILPLAFLAIISGCSDSNIDLVKKSTNPYWEDYTVSQLLDNREQCEKIEWKSFSDKNERDLVEYSCKLIPATEIIKQQITTSRPDENNIKEILRMKDFSENDAKVRANDKIDEAQRITQKISPENYLNEIEFIKTQFAERMKKISDTYERSMHEHKMQQDFSDLTAEKFDGVYESHQWVIRNGNPSFQGSFLVFKVKGEEDYNRKHDPKVVYKTAIEDSDKANVFLEFATTQYWQSINQKRFLEYEKQQP